MVIWFVKNAAGMTFVADCQLLPDTVQMWKLVPVLFRV